MAKEGEARLGEAGWVKVRRGEAGQGGEMQRPGEARRDRAIWGGAGQDKARRGDARRGGAR